MLEGLICTSSFNTVIFLCNLHIYCVIIYLMLRYKDSLEKGGRNVGTDANSSSEQTDISNQFY